MKATLLGALCLVLTGVIVGLASPRGSLSQPFEGVFRETPPKTQLVEASAPAEVAMPQAAPVSAAPEAPIEQASLAEPAPDSASSDKQAVDAHCAKLTEAARQGYMSAGYATQEFASIAIAAKADAMAAAKVSSVRDQYMSAMETARTQVAEASRAQCWSKFGMEPPNLTAFASSLPSAASEVLAQ